MNNKFREFLKNKNYVGCLVSILATIGLSTLVLVLAINGTEADPKAQVNQPKQEIKVLNNDIDAAYAYLKDPLDKSFNEVRHEVTKDGDMIILHLHISIADIENTTQEEWEDLKNNAVYAQSIWQKALELEGYGAEFSVCIGDLDKNVLYLAVSDGKVLYDGLSEVECELF